ARVRCLFLDTPLPDAQVNVVLRMLDRFGRVPEPDELAALAAREPAALAPRVLQRMVRQLEPPAADEGLAEIEVIRFAREPGGGGRAGVVVALDAALARGGVTRALAGVAPDARCLLYAWRPGAADAERARLQSLADAAAAATGAAVELALCPH